MVLCDNVVTEEELSATLTDMQNGSSPGPDGFTAKFFLVFWTELKELITSAVNEIFQKGKMPDSFKESIVTLIPKKSRPKTRVSCLRPINLLNVIYKVITKMLARRISKVIGRIVNEDQTGFVKGRLSAKILELL